MTISVFCLVFLVFLGGIQADCPDGFDPIGDQCIYSYEKKALNWHQAEMFCLYKESHLWSPKQADESFDPFEKLKKKLESIWIGGYLNPDSNWQWVNGSLITGTEYTE